MHFTPILVHSIDLVDHHACAGEHQDLALFLHFGKERNIHTHCIHAARVSEWMGVIFYDDEGGGDDNSVGGGWWW